MEVLGYVLAALVGISLGLVGSGGSILTVPILVYVMGINPVLATAYSLFIVGSTALVGGIQKSLQKVVNYKTVLIFGLPSIVAVYLTRILLIPVIPEVLFEVSGFSLTKPVFLMVLFAVVMVLASYTMIKPVVTDDSAAPAGQEFNYPMLFLLGMGVGVLTGLVGVGGGFLIIPSLVFFARMPMKEAVGTSLNIIAANSLIGFTGDIQGDQYIDWKLILIFTFFAVAGIFYGNYLCKRIDGSKLKSGFGWFILVMGIYILIRELWQ